MDKNINNKKLKGYSGIGSQNLQNLLFLVKRRTFVKQAAHPDSNYIRPDQFNFREHGFFSKFEGSVGRKKKENKKKSPIFCIGFDY